MFCPKCKAEYIKGVIKCKQCEVPLVANLADVPGPSPEPLKEIGFVSIVRTFNPQDIAIIESILEDSGIEYYVQGENGIHIRPFADPANVFVLKEQAADAIELLKDLDLSFYNFRPDHYEKNESDDESSSEVKDAESEEEA